MNEKHSLGSAPDHSRMNQQELAHHLLHKAKAFEVVPAGEGLNQSLMGAAHKARRLGMTDTDALADMLSELAVMGGRDPAIAKVEARRAAIRSHPDEWDCAKLDGPHGTSRSSNGFPKASKNTSKEQAVRDAQCFLAGYDGGNPESPVPIPADPAAQLELFLTTFYDLNDMLSLAVEKTKGFVRSVSEMIMDGAPDEKGKGVWFRANPISKPTGKNGTARDADVIAFKFILCESDKLPLELQLPTLLQAGVPVAFTVDSGGKSNQCGVKVHAKDADEFRAFSKRLLAILERLGFDKAVSNPSRLQRLPGAFRSNGRDGGRRQTLVYLDPAAATLTKETLEEIARRIESALPTNAPPIEAYYDAERREYLLKNQRGVWIPLTEPQFRRHLRAAGISSKTPESARISPIDEFLLDLQHTRDIQYAGRLCGKREGFYVEGQTRFLVTSSFVLPEPCAGEWPTIRAILEGLLCQSEPVHGGAQWHIFNGWMKTAQVSLRAGKIQPAQALAVAGPIGCGKSLLQTFITALLGGRSAKAARYMLGGTEFNGELFEAEHLALEDEFMSHRITDRLRLAAALKNVCVSSRAQSCHRKHRQAITLPAWWRVSISLNDDPEALLVLPPLDEHFADKLIILRASRFPFPMPMDSTESQDRLRRKLVEEIPAYLHWLLTDFNLPDEFADANRYVVTTWHHPDLKAALENLSPEADLLALIDLIFWRDERTAWRGTSEELQQRLMLDGETASASRKLLHWRNGAGTYLTRLASKQPARVKEARTAHRREFIIEPPPE